MLWFKLLPILIGCKSRTTFLTKHEKNLKQMLSFKLLRLEISCHFLNQSRIA